MAEFYVRAKGFLIDQAPIWFVGPFSSRNAGQLGIEQMKQMDLEIVTREGDIPIEAAKGIFADIQTGTNAKKAGLSEMNLISLIEEKVPADILARVNTPQPVALLEGIGQETLSIPAVEPPSEKNGKKEAGQPAKRVPAPKPAKVASTPIAGTQPPLAVVNDYGFAQVVQDVIKKTGNPHPRVFVVVKYAGTKQWLKNHGVEGMEVDRLDKRMLPGCIVIAQNIADRLQVLCELVGVIDIPGLPVGRIGDALTPEELEQAGTNLRWFFTQEYKPGVGPINR